VKVTDSDLSAFRNHKDGRWVDLDYGSAIVMADASILSDKFLPFRIQLGMVGPELGKVLNRGLAFRDDSAEEFLN
jgi:hypothetical protein